MALDEPIDVGDTYYWRLGGTVEVLSMYVDEDGNTQVRVNDRGEKRTVTSGDVVELLEGGALRRYTVDWEKPDAYPEC